MKSMHLSNNNLTGELTLDFGQFQNLSSLSLYDNGFTGGVPEVLSNCTQLKLLDLSMNELTGNIPDFKTNFSSMRIVSLASNNLEGEIPGWIWSLQQLQVLLLSGNTFTGILPTSFPLLDGMRVMSNNATLDRSQSTLYDLVLVPTKGAQLEYAEIILAFTSIDLSNNEIHGELPAGLDSLYALRLLNLSGNHFSGPIPAALGNITTLKSLDLLSNNELTGDIPAEVANLAPLAVLDVAHNNLSGKILLPGRTKFPASSFEGNLNLCGNPLNQTCTTGNAVPKILTRVRVHTKTRPFFKRKVILTHLKACRERNFEVA